MRIIKYVLMIFIYTLILVFTAAPQTEDYISESKKSDYVRLLVQKNKITDDKIINALQNTKRELFIPENMMDFLYKDVSIPVDRRNRTASPSDIIKAVNSAQSAGKNSALIIGNNSGYAAALLSNIYETVYYIEINISRRNVTDEAITENYPNIILSYGREINFFNSSGPFDFIFFHGSFKNFTSSFFENLSDSGIIAFPLSDSDQFQNLIKAEKNDDSFTFENIGQVYFPEFY